MNNKYLITIIIPNCDLEYDLFVPINKKVGTIKEKIVKSLYEVTKGQFFKTPNEVNFIDKVSGIEIPNDLYVKNSVIKNGTKILVI